MFHSIEVSGCNVEFGSIIFCGEFASLDKMPCEAWYKPDVMPKHVETWNKENPFYKISYTVDATYEDVASISVTTPAGRTISFTFGDDGEQYPGGAVGTFTIDFGEKGSGHLALNILQNLEYYDCLDQIESIKTSLPFEEVE